MNRAIHSRTVLRQRRHRCPRSCARRPPALYPRSHRETDTVLSRAQPLRRNPRLRDSFRHNPPPHSRRDSPDAETTGAEETLGRHLRAEAWRPPLGGAASPPQNLARHQRSALLPAACEALQRRSKKTSAAPCPRVRRRRRATPFVPVQDRDCTNNASSARRKAACIAMRRCGQRPGAPTQRRCAPHAAGQQRVQPAETQRRRARDLPRAQFLSALRRCDHYRTARLSARSGVSLHRVSFCGAPRHQRQLADAASVPTARVTCPPQRSAGGPTTRSSPLIVNGSRATGTRFLSRTKTRPQHAARDV